MINIRRDVTDSFYRYKMPRLQSKIEGKGNGIKTVIPNMSDIAKALSRPPAYPTKYFGCELGAQVKLDAAHDRYIVNGAHDQEKLQQTLDGFISRFVLCGECFNPETDLVIAKDGDINRDCKACGKITPVDGSHKLCRYIINNPPGAQAGAIYGSGGSGNGAVGSKKESKSRRRNQGKKSESMDSIQDAGEDEDEDAEYDENEAMDEQMRRDAAFLQSDDRAKSSLDDWSVDTSTEAIAARQREMEEVQNRINKKLNLADDDDDEDGADGNGPLDKFADFIEADRNVSDADILARIKELQLRDYKAVVVLMQTLFTDQIIRELPKRQKLISALMKNEKCQKAFLGGMERLVAVVHPDLLAKTPIILKNAYDMDLLDEEIIIAWGKKASKKYVGKEQSREIRKKAEPFLTWLETAEEETSDEDDDDE